MIHRQTVCKFCVFLQSLAIICRLVNVGGVFEEGNRDT